MSEKREDMVERVARAIAEGLGFVPDHDLGGITIAESYLAAARAAIEAMLGALPQAELLGDTEYSVGYDDGVKACRRVLDAALTPKEDE